MTTESESDCDDIHHGALHTCLSCGTSNQFIELDLGDKWNWESILETVQCYNCKNSNFKVQTELKEYTYQELCKMTMAANQQGQGESWE